LRGVVAFVDESDTAGPELLGGEKPVAERVGRLVSPALLRGGESAGQQFDAGTPVEACAYLVVVHLTPLERTSTAGPSHAGIVAYAWSVE
jgi:hypothetical protein